MKLYLWRPKGHGEFTFGVLAESHDEAKALVDQEISRWRAAGRNYETRGWDTPYYELEVFMLGQVFCHEND